MRPEQLRDCIAEAVAGLDAEDPGTPVCDSCRVVPVRWYRDLCPSCLARRQADCRRMATANAMRSLPEAYHTWAEVRTKADRRVIEALDGWRRDIGSVLILGPTGIGKTTATVARARLIIESAQSPKVDIAGVQFCSGIRWVDARTLASAAKAWPLGRGAAPEVEEATRATLLVLDELGYEHTTDEIPKLIETRYQLQRPTWTTTGRTMAELTKRYGDAIVRKLHAGGAIVDCHGGAQ